MIRKCPITLVICSYDFHIYCQPRTWAWAPSGGGPGPCCRFGAWAQVPDPKMGKTYEDNMNNKVKIRRPL